METEAALLVKPGKPLVVDEIEMPALKPGQVLIDITYSGACHTQILEAKGFRGEDPWCPHCLGHEAVGFVSEISKGVTKVKEGDEVVLTWLKGDGADIGGTQYQWRGQKVNAGGVTTFARKSIVSENRLIVKPAYLDSRLAILLGCAAPTGFGSVINVCEANKGQGFIILGAGGVGLCAIIAASYLGCDPIIAVDILPKKLDLAKQFGATHVINALDQNILEVLHKITPHGVDFSIEATGNPKVMAKALSLVRSQGGKAVVIGNAKKDKLITLDPNLFNQGKSLLGSWGGDSHPDRDFGKFSDIIVDKKHLLATLLSEPYKLSDINRVLVDLGTGKIGRPVIEMAL